MKLLTLFTIVLFLFLACTEDHGRYDHLKALEKEWEKHLKPESEKINVLKYGKTFALESTKTQGIDQERFREFDYWKEYDDSFFERMESKSFSNPLEDGGVETSLEIFKAIKKGEAEIRFYRKHYYGNRDPNDTNYVKDTLTYLYNIYRFKTN